MFVFTPQGGLCNRMRSMDAAISLASELGIRLSIQWHLDGGLNCRLEELFHLPEVIDHIVTIDYTGRFSKLRKTIVKRLNRFQYDVCLYERDLEKLQNSGASLLQLPVDKKIYIASCMRFFGSGNYFKGFKPTHEIMRRVEQNIGQQNTDHLIGVHVRRTDHGHSIARSPLAMFVEIMKEECRLDTKVKFFVATDCPETENDLQEAFGNKLLLHTKASLDRSNESAIKDAMVDLYCLAACRKIIGSYKSSFTDVAAQLGGAELNVVDNAESGS